MVPLTFLSGSVAFIHVYLFISTCTKSAVDVFIHTHNTTDVYIKAHSGPFIMKGTKVLTLGAGR